MKVLLIEDDIMLGESLSQGLANLGHAVDWLKDGVQADGALRNHVYALLLLDLSLPSWMALRYCEDCGLAMRQPPS